MRTLTPTSWHNAVSSALLHLHLPFEKDAALSAELERLLSAYPVTFTRTSPTHIHVKWNRFDVTFSYQEGHLQQSEYIGACNFQRLMEVLGVRAATNVLLGED